MSAIYQLWRFTAFGRYRLDLQNGSDGEGRTSQLASGLNVAGDEGAGACLVWIPYFLVSKRVKRTFVGATDHRVVLGPHGTGSDKAMSIVVGFGAKPAKTALTPSSLSKECFFRGALTGQPLLETVAHLPVFCDNSRTHVSFSVTEPVPRQKERAAAEKRDTDGSSLKDGCCAISEGVLWREKMEKFPAVTSDPR